MSNRIANCFEIEDDEEFASPYDSDPNAMALLNAIFSPDEKPASQIWRETLDTLVNQLIDNKDEAKREEIIKAIVVASTKHEAAIRDEKDTHAMAQARLHTDFIQDTLIDAGFDVERESYRLKVSLHNRSLTCREVWLAAGGEYLPGRAIRVDGDVVIDLAPRLD